MQLQNKAVVDIRLRPRCATSKPPSRSKCRIACVHIFSQYYLRLPGILNDPFFCMTLSAIELSLLQLTPQRRRSDRYSEDCQCFWMARTTPENCVFPLGDLHSHLTHDTQGPPKSSSQTASRLVQPFLYWSQMLCCAVHCQWEKAPKLPLPLGISSPRWRRTEPRR